MSVQTAPYNDSMRIGSGFNSYTQQLCIDNAVVKDDKASATDKDLKPKLHNGKTGDSVSQQVTFTSKFVENSSDVTEAMNVSGHLEIKWNGIGVKGSGSYLDSSAVKESDISYFVQVKVVNQQLIPDDLSRFNALSNVSAADRNRFTNIYGDCFVSGFLEGGEFNALLTVKVADKSKVKEIKGALSLSLEKGGFGISGEAAGGYDAAEILKHSETSISVSWAGGGALHDVKAENKKSGNNGWATQTPTDGGDAVVPDKILGDKVTENKNPENEGWTIKSMAKAAFSFADRVRTCPQRTHAILTKYSALRSYQVLTNKGSPLDYENSGVYTNALLESYMEYKAIAKDIQKMAQGVSDGVKTLVELPAAEEATKEIKSLKEDYVALTNAGRAGDPKAVKVTTEDFAHIPAEAYKPNLFSLEKARLHCRLQMVRIVKEVDAVAEDPHVAVDPYRVGQFLNPLIFRQLLPGIELRPSEQEVKNMREQIADFKSRIDTESKVSGEKLAAMETKCNAIQETLNAAPLTSEETAAMLERLNNVKQDLEEGSITRDKVKSLQEQLNEFKKSSPTTVELQELRKKCDTLEQESKALQSSPCKHFHMIMGDKFLCLMDDGRKVDLTPSPTAATVWELSHLREKGELSIKNSKTGLFLTHDGPSTGIFCSQTPGDVKYWQLETKNETGVFRLWSRWGYARKSVTGLDRDGKLCVTEPVQSDWKIITATTMTYR
ncbi:hypothetical protein PENFLA_c044G03126 [Penicillium flavigenum]|uniref:Uncharacterized protein n=1 Tax=Penicillium flavigenum TaxID=254877 RepID=A0A1V6SIA9_9EURO|nr:hypothetical protein PENFLA_c044G03126 [Penicillium flavigenum]